MVKNAVCCHEEDAGMLWKHTDYKTMHCEVGLPCFIRMRRTTLLRISRPTMDLLLVSVVD